MLMKAAVASAFFEAVEAFKNGIVFTSVWYFPRSTFRYKFNFGTVVDGGGSEGHVQHRHGPLRETWTTRS